MSTKEDIHQRNLSFIYGKDKEAAKHDPDKRVFVKSKPKVLSKDDIDDFSGDHEFLSPGFPCSVSIPDDLENPYPSMEHALQASKCDSQGQRESIRKAGDVREAKRLGPKPTAEWKARCVATAESLLRDKFMRNKSLRQNLVATKRKQLVFKNSFGDLFWGVSQENSGQNNLGKLLMKVRADIAEGVDIEGWLKGLLHFGAADKIDIHMKVYRDTEVIREEGKSFEKRTTLFFGKSDDCEIVCAHPSTSRLHAVVCVDVQGAMHLIDLGSSNGTYIRGEQVKPFVTVKLASTDQVRIGASSRLYAFTIDDSADRRRQDALYSKLTSEDAYQDSANDNTVFVRNLPIEATDSEIQSLFEPCGQIKSMTVPRSRETGESKGIAFITFATASEFMQAMCMDKDDTLGQPIRVKRNESKARPQQNRANDGDRERGGRRADNNEDGRVGRSDESPDRDDRYDRQRGGNGGRREREVTDGRWDRRASRERDSHLHSPRRRERSERSYRQDRSERSDRYVDRDGREGDDGRRDRVRDDDFDSNDRRHHSRRRSRSRDRSRDRRR
jgi:predicted NAD-dependent protein-ADP-ribosyltransferase YbiA (DUF1768 family)